MHGALCTNEKNAKLFFFGYKGNPRSHRNLHKLGSILVKLNAKSGVLMRFAMAHNHTLAPKMSIVRSNFVG